jgi:hypothetical protein
MLEVNHSPREPMVRRTLLTFLIAVALLAVFSAAVSAQQQPAREITQIKGDLYHFRNAGHFSVFLVTPAGIIATDPIDEGIARHIQMHRSGN